MTEQQANPQPPEQSALEQERLKKKKRKKIALGAALAVLAGAVSGWYFLYYTRTPQYAVKLIRESVNKHDIVTFQDHTDLTRVVERAMTPSSLPRERTMWKMAIQKGKRTKSPATWRN